ncbi:MAG: RNA methyltransferase [candidate division KSB1 bacterium]|nr:RNA methyltransferase [candidate division KSB1 bacterium]
MIPVENIIRIERTDDERLVCYCNVRDNSLAAHGLFLAEGGFLVQRLLESDYTVVSLFVSEKRLERVRNWLPADVPVYTAPESVLSESVGFHFHRGVMALARRQPLWSDDRMLSQISAIQRLLILPEINNTENLGLILRSAAGLGFSNVLLGSSCCDPFSRRALRTGMGASLRLHLAVSADLNVSFAAIRDLNIPIHAAALTADAAPLNQVRPPERVALMLGPEAYGLTEDCLRYSDQSVVIPMHNDTDSLNVAVAAGILMYHYRI